MSVVEQLETGTYWKAQGNTFFKSNEIFKAADAYYHAILFCRDLTNNPQYYPNLGHNAEQRKMAQDIVEGAFSNLALVQVKYGTTLQNEDPERKKILLEAVKSSTEALKINSKNAKCLFQTMRYTTTATISGMKPRKITKDC